MLKTFVASLRSDKAVKELDKIGVKVKEIGDDGVERFRNVQDVILELAVKMKYSEKDVQKTLLAVSGGKFQWSKVAAMLSNYEEIMKNWKLAIDSQGFTNTQVEKQLDTVARKFQTIKDEITGIIANGASGGISDVLKSILDKANALLHLFNNFDTATLKVTTLIAECAVFAGVLRKIGIESPFDALIPNAEKVRKKIRLATVETKGFGRAFKTLEVTAVMSLRSIKIAMTKCLPTLAVVAAAEAFGSFLELLGEYESRIGRVAEAKQLEFEANATVINNLKEQQKYTEGLITTYGALLEVQKSKKVSGKEEEELNKKIEETEKELTETIDKSAVDRIKSSDNVKEAAKKEADSARENSNTKIGALEEEQNKLLEWGRNKLRVHKAELARIVKERQAFIDSIEKKIWAVKDLWLAEKAYYAWKFNMLKYTDIELKAARAEEAMAKREYEEAEANYNPSDNADDWTPFYTLTHENPALKKYKYDAAQIKVKQLEERLEQENKEAAAIKESLADKTGLKIDDALANIEKYKWADPNSNPNYQDPENKQTNQEADNGKGGRSGSRRDTTKYHDPVFDHIAALLKSIDETTQRQEKIFDRQVNREGYSKDTLEKQWKFYSETLSQLRKLKEDNAKHGREVLSNVYKDGIMVDTIDDDVNSSIAGWAKKEGDKWQGKFTDDLEKQCDSFVAAFYEELGLTKANGQKFGDDIARGGDFGGAYHPIGDGYKPQPGDFIDWGHHVGIYVGGGKYLARNSKGGIHIGSMEGMESEFGKLEGYGAIRELPNRYALPVDIKELLDKRNGNGVALKDMPAEELIKALEDIRDNTFEVDSETGVMTSKPRTEGDTDLSKEQKLALTQLISVLKTEVTQNNSIDDNYAKTEDNQRSKYLAGIKDIMNEDKESIARYYEDLNEMFRGGRSSFEEAQNAFNKATLEVTLYSNTIEDLKAKGIKGKKELKEFTDGLRSANKAQREALLKMKQNYFSDFNSKAEHEYNMQDFRSKNDPFGRKKATAELDKFAQELSALYVKKMSMYNELTLEEQYKLDEEIKTMQEKLDEGLNAYHDKLMAGYNSIVQDLIFQGKNLKEVLTTLWQDLGKDSWEKLFTGKISNPSFLTQMLGYGRPDKNRAEYDKLINSNITDMLAESYNFLGKSNSNLGEKILDMKDKLGEGMSLVDSKTALQITNNNMLQANTIALQNLATTMGVSSASGTGTGLLGGLLGGVGGTAAKTAAAAGPSLGWADLVLATGGRLDGASKSKFADGGAMASGKIVGAGTGRSDSILAYLANKDKFVWLSNGEYVINEKSAKALGYDTLDSLNKYADGGALQTSVTNPTPYIPTINPQVAQKATTIHGSNKITEALLREQNKHMKEQNEMLRNMGNSSEGGGKMVVLNTQASSADVLRALQENPRALQAILGRQKSMGFR